MIARKNGKIQSSKKFAEFEKTFSRNATSTWKNLSNGSVKRKLVLVAKSSLVHRGTLTGGAMRSPDLCATLRAVQQ